MKQDHLYQSVRNWIYRNARPLDLARWQYHFEQGSKAQVIDVLTEYQNEDGGFGFGLEADAWNPNSSPIQTFRGIEILNEIGFRDRSHPIIQGILRYLDSGKDYEQGAWLNTVETNNAYPHAPRWEMESNSTSHNRFNPTAGLAGFGLLYGEQGSSLYRKCEDLAREAVAYIEQSEELDMHVLGCFITLWENCREAGIENLFSVKEMELKLRKLVQRAITQDTTVWATSYCCKPSQFLHSPECIFYEENAVAANYECEFIRNTVGEDGVWAITWSWAAYPEEWAVAKNWWKANVAINNIRYLSSFQKIEVK